MSMLNFANNLEDLANEIGKWKGMSNGINQKEYMDSLINRAFDIVEPKFNMAAALSADDFDFAHMYEYGTRGVGTHTGEDGSLDPMSPNSRLWENVLLGGGGRKEIAFVFLPANEPNPPKTEENTGGADADFERLRVNQGEEYIWYQKAETIELNKSVFIKVRDAKALFIPINQGGIKNITEKEQARGFAFRKQTVSRPGQWTGGAGQFTSFFAGWWGEQGGTEMETAMMEQFNEDVKDFNAKNPPRKSKPKPADTVNVNGTAETADRKFRKQWEIYTKNDGTGKKVEGSMTIPAVIPAYLIRQYVWAVLKANEPTDWSEENYGGKMPVVPLGEEADLEPYNKPTIVYQFTDLRTGTMWMRGRGAMTFAIRSTNLRQLTRALTILKEALNRYDESARDVNEYLDKRGEPWNSIGFGEIHVTFADGGAPATTEGGEMVSVISIEFDYFTDYGDNPDPLITRPLL